MQALGNAPALAVASGVTVDNVGLILPYIDIFMVSSGIECVSADEKLIQFYREAQLPAPVQVGHLDAAKVAALAASIHGFSQLGSHSG